MTKMVKTGVKKPALTTFFIVTFSLALVMEVVALGWKIDHHYYPITARIICLLAIGIYSFGLILLIVYIGGHPEFYYQSRIQNFTATVLCIISGLILLYWILSVGREHLLKILGI